MFENVYANKRVLVTGHTGFKGSWLCQWLVELGAEVAGVSINVPTKPSHFEALNLAEEISHFTGDVRDFDRLSAIVNDFRPDIVFHLAAQAVVFEAYREPRQTYATNLMGTINVLDCLRVSGRPCVGVIITSDKCYENVEWEYGYRESDVLGGKDPYSASKAAAEIAYSSYARSFFADSDNIWTASARAGNVIGGGDWAAHRIVPDCIRAWAENGSPDIRSPEATRPWQHVLEPLSGYLSLGSALFRRDTSVKSESFNFGPSVDAQKKVADLLEEMLKVWENRSWKIVPKVSTQQEATLLSLNCDKARNRLQWQTTLTFEECTRLTAEWYRDFYNHAATAQDLTRHQIKAYTNLAREKKMRWALG